MSLGCTSVLNHYLSGSGKYFDKAGKHSEDMERLFMIGQYTSSIASNAHRLNGNLKESEKCDEISNRFGLARSTLGAVRVIFPIEKALSGKLLWQRYSAADASKITVLDETGQRLIKEGEFKVVEVDDNGNPILDDNGQPKYLKRIDVQGKRGSYVLRDWLDIAMDVLVLVARVLSPVSLIHKLKAVNLGEHAKRIGTTISVLWGVILSLNLVQNIRDMVKVAKSPQSTSRDIRKQAGNTFVATTTFLAIPFDTFDFGALKSAHPAIGIVGGSICLLDAVAYWVNNVMAYE